MPRSDAFAGVTAESYAARAERSVPGLAGLHRMVALLLAERVPDAGHLLVLGAGGGLEIAALGAHHAGWRFTGVDPSPDMLAAAREVCAGMEERVALIEGMIGEAPAGPFDGAVSLLTFHFIPEAGRLEVLRALRARLRPGAPFIMAHLSVAEGERVWLRRHVVYGAGDGADPAQLARSVAAMEAGVHLVAPAAEERMLAAAGFSGVALFWQAFALRGWVAHA
jgi:tRNA (cmo5U34)-methyltransferase